MDEVILLNPTTCGINKDGGPRYKVDQSTGKRTQEIDNEMALQVAAYLGKKSVPGLVRIPLERAVKERTLVPRYYDARWVQPFKKLCRKKGWKYISIGELEKLGYLKVRGGHGSPSNDKRSGHIPYVKVSDIRNLRVNINPTNLVTETIAKIFWRGSNSGLQAWDLLTPNRASSNIGEFAVLLPGEEAVVLTKEVFVFRIQGGLAEGWSPFYLLWALCLKSVRQQWQRITLMQTNREDVGRRYREILLPVPASKAEADEVAAAFEAYFQTIAKARASFKSKLENSDVEFIASVFANIPVEEDE